MSAVVFQGRKWRFPPPDLLETFANAAAWRHHCVGRVLVLDRWTGIRLTLSVVTPAAQRYTQTAGRA